MALGGNPRGGTVRSRAESILARRRVEQLNAQLAEANDRLNALATIDPLTGLPNRRLFEQRFKEVWRQSVREGLPFALLVIDVDHFKQYNDRFGHPAGDDCLRKVSATLAMSLRPGDVAARLGGEEFALLLPGSHANCPEAVAERVRKSVEALGIDHPLNDAGVVTISVGIASGTAAQWSEEIRPMRAADQALYEAKAAGRNRVALFAGTMSG